MADFPRWVNDPKVDSTAMLSAYMNYVHKFPPGAEPDFAHHLWTIDHIMPFASGFEDLRPMVNDITIPSKPCTNPSCPRCLGGLSGYQFKWYHHEWYNSYVQMARPGSWRLHSPVAMCPM